MADMLANATRRLFLLNTVFGQLWREIVVCLDNGLLFGKAMEEFTCALPKDVDSYRQRQSDIEIERIVKLALMRVWKFANPTNEGEPPTFDFKTDEFSNLRSTLQSYPNYLSLQSDSWAKSIIIHLETKDDEGRRRDALESALNDNGLELRADSRFCQDFIEDEECREIAESRAVFLRITMLLGPIFKMEATLKEMALEDGLGWIPAAESLVASHDFRSKATSAHQQYESNRHEHTFCRKRWRDFDDAEDCYGRDDDGDDDDDAEGDSCRYGRYRDCRF
ncbi:UNVERIFIED_CONTAM: hypothetical protein HDU68_002686 [Siphonaria sp. JEL0065]|nr:hypothetical protein HDU68_002686 [Siphonaria sp. JEL0065]